MACTSVMEPNQTLYPIFQHLFVFQHANWSSFLETVNKATLNADALAAASTEAMKGVVKQYLVPGIMNQFPGINSRVSLLIPGIQSERITLKHSLKEKMVEQ